MKNNLLLFTLVIASFLTVNTMQAQNWWKNGIKGEGQVVKKSINLKSFTGFTLTTTGNVYLRKGSSQSVEVESHQNIIDNLETEVNDNHWKIKFDKPVRKYDKLNFYITVPSLSAVRISGSGDIISDDTFTGLGNLDISISGSGNIKLGAEASEVVTRISGSGDIKLAGKTTDMSIKISGSGDVRAYDMVAENCKVSISGSGDVKVHANENLYVRSSGSGDIYYMGRPRIDSKVSGSSDITSRRTN